MGPTFSDAVGPLASLVAVGAGSWLVLSVVLAALATLPGRLGRGARRSWPALTPAMARRVLTGGVTALLAVGPPPALAHERPTPTGTAALDGLLLPDRPQSGPAPAPYRVRPGDSLWAIAERELAGTTDDAAITARWHAWYCANHRVIGPDPDLLHPGQLLTSPSDERTRHE